MSDSEYSVIKSDVIKGFDCTSKRNRTTFGPLFNYFAKTYLIFIWFQIGKRSNLQYEVAKSHIIFKMYITKSKQSRKFFVFPVKFTKVH